MATVQKQFTRVPAAIAVAVGLLFGASSAQADALAQAHLDIINLQFAYNGNVSLVGSPGVAINSSATFANAVGATTPGFGTSTSRAGPNGAQFTTSGEISSLVIPQFNYAGGHASQSGNSAPGGGGANALTNAVVSVVPAGGPLNSSSGGNTVSQQFTISVAGPTAIGVSFQADLFIRAFLNAGANVFQGGNAQGKTTWRLSLSQLDAGSFEEIATWDPANVSVLNPNGGLTCDTTFGISGCVSNSAFRLNRIVDAFNSPENNVVSPAVGNFSAGFNLDTGTYRFQITHESQASAFLLVPEPGSLALVGLALVGLGVASRRRVTKAAA